MTGQTKTGRIRILCVDDSPRLTAAWAKMFSLQPDLEVVGTLDRADGVADFVRDRGADVILLDLTMDGRDPLQVIAELAAQKPDARVIVCSGHSDPATAERALEAGAWGFIGKHEDPALITDAIRKVARGEVVMPPSVIEIRPAARASAPIAAPRSAAPGA